MRTALHVKFRENTGNFRDFKARDILCSWKAPAFSPVFVKIPYSRDQGISKCYQGIFLRDQGIYPEITGTTARSLFIHGWHSTVQGTLGVKVGRGADGFLSSMDPAASDRVDAAPEKFYPVSGAHGGRCAWSSAGD